MHVYKYPFKRFLVQIDQFTNKYYKQNFVFLWV